MRVPAHWSTRSRWIKDGWVGKVTQVESWMSRNTPHGKGQWVRPVPSDCTAQNVELERVSQRTS